MQINRRDLMTSAGLALLGSTLPARAAAVRSIGGAAFGSYWRAVLPVGADFAALGEGLQGVLDQVDRQMSPFRPASDLVRLNAAKGGIWLPLTPDLHAVVDESLAIARLTGGAFDPTVGPVVGRFGFGPIKGAARLGFGALDLGPAGLKKADPRATLDLCGIAKGYALDRMADLLRDAGVGTFMLEAGGEVFAHGQHPDGRAWQVGIERPGLPDTGFQRIITLDGLALATSGQSANGGQIGGIGYSHIIDPGLARPVVSDVLSVSVLAPMASTADALATALMVLGPIDGPALANRQGISALFLAKAGDGLREIMTGRFSRHVVI